MRKVAIGERHIERGGGDDGRWDGSEYECEEEGEAEECERRRLVA